jgi:hypothetical protein
VNRQLANSHLVTLANEDLVDETAIEVLDRLAGGLHGNDALGNGCAVDWSEGRPGAESPEGYQQHEKPETTLRLVAGAQAWGMGAAGGEGTGRALR